MIIENSIESRILQLQEKKKALFQSTVGKDLDALTKVLILIPFFNEHANGKTVIRRRLAILIRVINSKCLQKCITF